MTHPLDKVAPPPDASTATACKVAGWQASNALFHLGRAARRRELHGSSDTGYRHLSDLAAQETHTAYVLQAMRRGAAPDATARELLAATEAGDDIHLTATRIAGWAGYDPAAAYRAGYES